MKTEAGVPERSDNTKLGGLEFAALRRILHRWAHIDLPAATPPVHGSARADVGVRLAARGWRTRWSESPPTTPPHTSTR